MDSEVDCTGISAGWCPIHGDCLCPTNEYGETLSDDGEEDRIVTEVLLFDNGIASQDGRFCQLCRKRKPFTEFRSYSRTGVKS